MINIAVKNNKGKTVENCSLPEDVFGVQTNVSLIHQVVTAERSAMRQGTHKVKTRAEVSGGGKKPYRQKGTGNARQGSIRAPQYAGGGVVHGPVNTRDYSQNTPKKMVKSAIRGLLSNRVKSNHFYILEPIKGVSTKNFLQVLNNCEIYDNILFVTNKKSEYLSARNLPFITVVQPNQINAYDIVVNKNIVWTNKSIVKFVGDDKIKFTPVDKKHSKNTDNINNNSAVSKNNDIENINDSKNVDIKEENKDE